MDITLIEGEQRQLKIRLCGTKNWSSAKKQKAVRTRKPLLRLQKQTSYPNGIPQSTVPSPAKVHKGQGAGKCNKTNQDKDNNVLFQEKEHIKLTPWKAQIEAKAVGLHQLFSD